MENMIAPVVGGHRLPEQAHGGREFFRTFRCVNYPAIEDEKLFEIHCGVHSENLLALIATPSEA